MSEVEKFNCMLVHGFPCMMPKENGLWVQSANFDDAQSELAALREELAHAKDAINLKQRDLIEAQTAVNGWAAKCKAAEQRNAILFEALTEERRIRLLGQQENINWESLRDCRRSCYAKTDAALKPTESGASE